MNAYNIYLVYEMTKDFSRIVAACCLMHVNMNSSWAFISSFNMFRCCKWSALSAICVYIHICECVCIDLILKNISHVYTLWLSCEIRIYICIYRDSDMHLINQKLWDELFALALSWCTCARCKVVYTYGEGALMWESVGGWNNDTFCVCVRACMCIPY